MQQENTPIKVGLLELLYVSQGTQFVIPAFHRNYTLNANTIQRTTNQRPFRPICRL